VTAIAREKKLQRQLETIKTSAEFYECEFFAKGGEIAREAAAHFATIAMGAGFVLEEVIEARECEKTGKLPSYCV
jgi:hypothetical protein